ncbi:protein arginine kinase [Dehalobacterium formicoaceticum]|uniref:Protein-arginine kinase n=1 Tax=Dehalobacterium formicoaceticum TaxID=51515 RepID=A0ABT1XZ61_9FIRM|nr:protein arginine kinase [Dehalobacterium formicoaceticum]MCR6543920.1 protein arginine kinase [Dehalobacterium formicoaceticum]
MDRGDIFSRPDSKWTEGKGPDADIVISSRVRLARNIKNMPFPYMLSEEKEQEILNAIKDIIETPGFREKMGTFYYIPLNEIDQLEKQMLVEKHLISPQFAQSKGYKGVIVREDESLSIMVNEEDHFRIQCLLPAMQLNDAWVLANQMDDILEQTLEFAFDKEKGYLTSCPTNVGTGMRASVMLHLPGLVFTRMGYQIFSTMGQIGLTVRGMYGEGSEASGNLFQISNQVTLGLTEEDIINHLTSVTLQVIDQERNARNLFLKEGKDQLEDRVWRAYGILSHARNISSQEAMKLLSDLRLGIDLNLIQGIDPTVFNNLMVATQMAFLQQKGKGEMQPHLRDQIRAATIREKITKKNGGHESC